MKYIIIIKLIVGLAVLKNEFAWYYGESLRSSYFHNCVYLYKKHLVI